MGNVGRVARSRRHSVCEIENQVLVRTMRRRVMRVSLLEVVGRARSTQSVDGRLWRVDRVHRLSTTTASNYALDGYDIVSADETVILC